MNVVEQSVTLWPIPFTAAETLRHVERAGRVCYKSEDKITDDSAEGFVRRIVERGHESVLEHGNIILMCDKKMYKAFRQYQKAENAAGRSIFLRFTRRYDAEDRAERFVVSGNLRAWRACVRYFIEEKYIRFDWMEAMANKYSWAFFDMYAEMMNNTARDYTRQARIMDYEELEGVIEQLTHMCITMTAIVDRGITHELVRHRPASYSQESTRYCNYLMGKFGSEISVIDPLFSDMEAGNIWQSACYGAERAYNALIEKGVKPQIARSVLPTCLKADLVITANLRELLHMIHLRSGAGAHPQAIAWATQTRELLREEYPKLNIDEWEGWVADGF